MTPRQARELIRIHSRSGMYYYPLDRSHTIAFIAGYETGARGRCTFTKDISEYLISKYRIKPNQLGWEDQVGRLAARLKLEWIDTYGIVSAAVLSSAVSNPSGRGPRRRGKPHKRQLA